MNLFFNKLRLLLLFVVAFSTSMSSQLHWRPQNSGTNNTLTYVDFINNDTGLVVGNSGTLLTTKDGGENWNKINLGLSDVLSTVDFVDENVVFICGSTGLVMKSVDGGTTWTKLNSGVFTTLYSINFVDKDTGYAAGLNGVIIKTTDGGTTWIRENTPTSDHIYRVHFLNKDTGFVAANDGVILRTVNGGTSWVVLNTLVSQRLHYVNFGNSNTGFAVGDNGTFITTNDLGNTWTKLNLQTNNLLNCVKTLDEKYAYVVGEGGLIFKTEDGGNTWKDDNSGISSRLVSVCFPSKNTGYSVGLNGKILKLLSDSIELKYCTTDTTATLIAPDGYQTYKWTNSLGNVVGAGKILVIKNDGTNNTFFCSVSLIDDTEFSLQTTLKSFLLKADFVSNTVNCKSDIVEFANLSYSSESTISYKWNFGDGKESEEQNPKHSYQSPGKYKVKLEILTPLSSCPDTITKDVEVFSPLKIEIQGDTLCCKGNTLIMRAIGAPAYLWSNGSTSDTILVNENSGKIWAIGLFDGGVCVSDTVFKTIKSGRYSVTVSGYQTYCPELSTKISAHGAENYFWSSGISSESIDILAPGGDYWVFGQSLGGCYSDTLYFSVSEEPDWDFSVFGQMSFCKSDSTEIVVNGSVSNIWFDNSTQESIFISKPGGYSVIGLNRRGCEKEINFTVKENEIPNALFIASTSFVDRKNNTLAVSVIPEPFTDYFWEMGDGSTAEGANHQHTYDVRNNKLEYRIRLTATNKFGCVSYTEQSVDVVPFIPNVFTPNNDGINDIFVPDIDVFIIDRFGKSLYRGTEGWNGTFRGKDVPNDTYFYFVYYTDKYEVVQTRKGSVTLIR